MKYLLLLLIITWSSIQLVCQEVIKLPVALQSDQIQWENQEKEFFSDTWQTEVVTNVAEPEIVVYQPDNPNGTCMIIAPGGGLYALSIENEGREVANWLTSKGVTAILLKYRLAPTGMDGTAELMTDGEEKVRKKLTPLIPLSISDGLTAISYIRNNADKWRIDPNKIGLMGFSAGGAVTMGVLYNYNDPSNRPDFIIPVYPWTVAYPVQTPPTDAPPMLIVCATDDPLDLAKGSIELYSSYLEAQKPVELHMYEKGGHGFGMKTMGTTSDNWIERIGDWLASRNMMD